MESGDFPGWGWGLGSKMELLSGSGAPALGHRGAPEMAAELHEYVY